MFEKKIVFLHETNVYFLSSFVIRLKALAEISAKNVIVFGRVPYSVTSKSKSIKWFMRYIQFLVISLVLLSDNVRVIAKLLQYLV